MFSEVKAATISVDRSLGSSGGTKLRHIIFVIIESGMILLVFQLVTMVLWDLQPLSLGPVNDALNYVADIDEMLNVIIRSVHFYFFCFTEIFTLLGNHTNNSFGASVIEIVLRRRRIPEGSCWKSTF